MYFAKGTIHEMCNSVKLCSNDKNLPLLMVPKDYDACGQ